MSIERRLQRITARLMPDRARDAAVLAAEVAAIEGVSIEQVIAEAEALHARYGARRLSPRELAADVAAEYGRDPDEVWREARRIMDGTEARS